jgi:putative ABC transport system permease protein
MDSRNNHYVTLVGRLLPGVTPRDAQADADAIARQIEEQLPQKVGFGAQVVSVTEQLTEDVRPALLILFGAVGLLLLVGCVNVANLLLARAVGRQREMAVRASLGATGARLFRQALIESVVLAALAGVAGVVFAWWGLEAMASLLPSNLPRHNAIGVDARVLLFALGASALTVILFGVLPALQVGRGDVQDRLKQAGARTTDGRGRRRLRSLLVAGETALALMLLVGAALLGRSFVRLHGVDPGFSADAIAMRIQLPPAKYAEATRGVAFFDQLVERLRALPGVKAVGAASGLPLGFGAGWGKFLSVEDGPPPRSVADIPLVDFAIAGSDYFRAAGIAVRGGRAFAETDGAKSLQVAVVNEAAARRFYGNGDAVGRWIRMCPPPSLMPEATCPRRQIVGVVADTKREGLNLPTKPQAWIPYRQFDQEGWLSELTLVLRVEGSPTSILPAAREQVRALDPDQPIGEIVTGAELRARSLSLSRFSLLLFGGFAVLAGLLATFGIYGVISYLTAQRTQEIGVRLALGARPRDVVMLVLRQAMGMVVLGVAVGIGAAFALGHVLRSLLFGVGPSDLFSYVVVAAPLMGVALLACWAPARRAARLDPIRSLRAE